MSDYDLDELKEYLKEVKQEAGLKSAGVPLENSGITNFINGHSLQHGEFKVPSYVIYMKYIQYCREKMTYALRKKRYLPPAFFKVFKQSFTQRRNGNQRFYMLNTDFGIDKEGLKKIKRTYDRDYNPYTRTRPMYKTGTKKRKEDKK